MKQPYALVFILMAICFLGALIAGPHSCQGGLEIYLYYGIAALIACVIILAANKTIDRRKKTIAIPVTILMFALVWIGGIFIGNFSLMCRLF